MRAKLALLALALGLVGAPVTGPGPAAVRAANGGHSLVSSFGPTSVGSLARAVVAICEVAGAPITTVASGATHHTSPSMAGTAGQHQPGSSAHPQSAAADSTHAQALTAPDAHHGAALTCTASASEQEAAQELTRRTTEVLRRRFPTSERALLAGYKATNSPLDHTVHYLSVDEQRDPRILDPEHPEGLIFAKSTHGGRLLAAMYIMPRPGQPGPRVGGCLTTWHHHTLEDGRDTPEMLHVWVVENAAGAFAEGYQQPS